MEGTDDGPTDRPQETSDTAADRLCPACGRAKRPDKPTCLECSLLARARQRSLRLPTRAASHGAADVSAAANRSKFSLSWLMLVMTLCAVTAPFVGKLHSTIVAVLAAFLVETSLFLTILTGCRWIATGRRFSVWGLAVVFVKSLMMQWMVWGMTATFLALPPKMSSWGWSRAAIAVAIGLLALPFLFLLTKVLVTLFGERVIGQPTLAERLRTELEPRSSNSDEP